MASIKTHIARQTVDSVAEKTDSVRDSLSDMLKDAAWDAAKIFAALFFAHDNIEILALMAAMIGAMIVLRLAKRGCHKVSTRAEIWESLNVTPQWSEFEDEMRDMIRENGGR